MRTTLDLDPDVLAAAKELARRRKLSTGRVISELVREALHLAVAANHGAKVHALDHALVQAARALGVGAVLF